MQHDEVRSYLDDVVFTLQTAGRCNSYDEEVALKMLFLPCKQQADATHLT